MSELVEVWHLEGSATRAGGGAWHLEGSAGGGMSGVIKWRGVALALEKGGFSKWRGVGGTCTGGGQLRVPCAERGVARLVPMAQALFSFVNYCVGTACACAAVTAGKLKLQI